MKKLCAVILVCAGLFLIIGMAGCVCRDCSSGFDRLEMRGENSALR